MGQSLLQPSFAGGELDPALWGRVDLDRYGIGARLMSNWIVRPYGGIATRPGTQLVAEVKYSDRLTRLLPFHISEDLAYVVELGHLYARFHYQGQTLVDAGVPVEIVTPWAEADLRRVRYTQSADTMFLVHPDYPARLIRRTGASSFAVSLYVPREGPFRSVNADEALLMAASAKTGTVTVEANFDAFTADLVGSLLYLEPKSLGRIKPWVQGERTSSGGELAVGVQRRSDGKYYRASSVPSAGASPNYTETGNVRPTHDIGKEWDGPGDKKTFDTIDYITGVQWEYLHSGYGVVEITAYVDARHVTGIVRRTLPDDVVGGLGAPGGTWTHDGDGATTVFAIAGATSDSALSYTVDINGVPTQSDPNYVPPPGSGGYCVHVDSILPGEKRAGEIAVGDELHLYDPVRGEHAYAAATYSRIKSTQIVRVITAKGISLMCSEDAPIPIVAGELVEARDLTGHVVVVMDAGIVSEDRVVEVVPLGEGLVQHITVGDRCFWAGEQDGRYLLHHNAKPIDIP